MVVLVTCKNEEDSIRNIGALVVIGLYVVFFSDARGHLKVIEKHGTGTGAIKRQIPLLKPKREINKYYK